MDAKDPISTASGFPVANVAYTSFDGGTHLHTRFQRPDRYVYWDRPHAPTPRIARGAGLSYTAASFSKSSLTIDHGAFNRLLAFNPEHATVEVEAGATLGQLCEFLTPRKLYLPVQPGHPSITVGGCAASDVHGKNQFKDGTFIRWIKSACLYHPRHGIVTLNPVSHPDLFRLTFGGYGLTGNILSLELQARPIPSPWAHVKTTPIDDIHTLPELLAQAADRSELVYTWHCFTDTGKSFGKGFLREGNFAPADDTITIPVNPVGRLASERRGSWKLAFFNSATTAAFNRLYHALHRKPAESKISFYDFLFPVHNKQAYFKLFGARGFLEYQVIIPFAKFPEAIDRIHHRLQNSPIPITLASAKWFRGENELLRFTGTGVCLALNFPRTQESLEFAGFLDQLTVLLGFLPNLIKDSRLSADVVAAAYPGYEKFQEALYRFDPERLYRSSLSERLKL